MKVKVNAGKPAVAAGMGLLGGILFVVLWTLLLAAIAAVAVWLVPIATAGALVVGFWQSVAALVLLTCLRGILTSK